MIFRKFRLYFHSAGIIIGDEFLGSISDKLRAQVVNDSTLLSETGDRCVTAPRFPWDTR